MLYRYDKQQLIFRSVRLKTYLKLITITISGIAISSFASYKMGRNDSVNALTEFEKVTIIKRQDVFNQDKLILMMQELKVKFPWIPMAQSIVETGHWKSNIFVENNNLFGMKESTRRISTAGGTQNNHAYYDTWRESVYDYAFYQCRYLGSIDSEQEYFDYLSASYAEDPNYIKTLKATIKKYKLKEQFN